MGQLLRRAREAHGWTHEDVVARIDASLGSYSRWERDKNTPQGHNLQQLIAVLELDPAEAVAAAGGVVAPGVQAAKAAQTAEAAADEVSRLRVRVDQLEQVFQDPRIIAALKQIAEEHEGDTAGSTSPSGGALQRFAEGVRALDEPEQPGLQQAPPEAAS
jgi:transcriptional regulator with XRE-family HTH domain